MGVGVRPFYRSALSTLICPIGDKKRPYEVFENLIRSESFSIGAARWLRDLQIYLAADKSGRKYERDLRAQPLSTSLNPSQLLSTPEPTPNHLRFSKDFPGYHEAGPRSSSILSSWLYFAMRSEREAEPVLI